MYFLRNRYKFLKNEKKSNEKLAENSVLSINYSKLLSVINNWILIAQKMNDRLQQKKLIKIWANKKLNKMFDSCRCIL